MISLEAHAHPPLLPGRIRRKRSAELEESEVQCLRKTRRMTRFLSCMMSPK
jgi:hypothetical protein